MKNNTILEKAKHWLDCIKKETTEQEYRLINRAVECLLGNVIEADGGQLQARRLITPSKSAYLGVWNWDSAFHAIGVMRFDTTLAYEQCAVFLDGQDKRGMFMDAYLANGKVFNEITKPPVLAWALMRLHQIDKNTFDVRYVYNRLVKNEGFWCRYRKKDGLFHYDTFSSADTDYYTRAPKNESGWDTSVRWDGGASNVWAVDLNCYMVLVYRALRYFGMFVGDDVTKWQQKEEVLVDKINCVLWNNKQGTYFDYDYREKRFTGIYSPAQFMPLYIGIASKEQASQMLSIAQDENKFYPLFPTVSYDNPEYTPSDYWRGPTWLNVAYFAVKGLKDYGFEETALSYRKRFLDMCDKETTGIYEYYNSKTGAGLGEKQFGWSAVFIMEFILNF